MSNDFPENSEVKRWQMPEVGTGFTEDENYQRGYQAGLAEGRAQAFAPAAVDLSEQHEAEWQKKTTHIQRIFQVLQKPLSLIDQQVEQAIVDLIQQLVMRLSRDQFQGDRVLLKRVLQDALLLLPLTDQVVTVTANPEDIRLLKHILHDVEDRRYELKEDISLLVGDIMIHTRDTTIDASLSARLHNLMEQVTDDETTSDLVSAPTKI